MQIDADAGACRAPTSPSFGSPDAEDATCIDSDAGVTIDARPRSCRDPHGVEARAVPPLLGPDGGPYRGVLLDDILEYRSLRANMLAGHHIVDDAHTRYLELEDKLRAHEPSESDRAHLRAFHRFDVQLEGGVRFRISGQRVLVPAGIENISAGGVKVSMPDVPPIGEPVWLQLRLHNGALAILPSRVVWSRGHAVGLMFAGAPRWS